NRPLHASAKSTRRGEQHAEAHRFHSELSSARAATISQRPSAGPEIADGEAFRERVFGVQHVLADAADVGAARDRRDDCLIRADLASVLKEVAREDRSENALVSKRLAERELAAGV